MLSIALKIRRTSTWTLLFLSLQVWSGSLLPKKRVFWTSKGPVAHSAHFQSEWSECSDRSDWSDYPDCENLQVLGGWQFQWALCSPSCCSKRDFVRESLPSAFSLEVPLFSDSSTVEKPGPEQTRECLDSDRKVPTSGSVFRSQYRSDRSWDHVGAPSFLGVNACCSKSKIDLRHAPDSFVGCWPIAVERIGSRSICLGAKAEERHVLQRDRSASLHDVVPGTVPTGRTNLNLFLYLQAQLEVLPLLFSMGLHCFRGSQSQ